MVTLVHASDSQSAAEAAHKHSIFHRAEILRSERCGCFHCLAVFEPSAIARWVDQPQSTEGEPPGETALCPECGIDAVIGSAAGYPLTHEFLSHMQRRWF